MFAQIVRHCSQQVRCQLINEIKHSSSASSVSNILQNKIKQIERFSLKNNVYNVRKYHSSTVSIASPEENEEFNKIFPDLVKELTDKDRHTDIRDIINWYTRILEYNVPHSKKRRGLGTVLSYKILEDPQRLTPENIKLANIIGWCAEMLHGFFLMYDDLMDHSDKRHGATCWYKLEDVGLSGINDATMLENSIYTILRRYFREHPAYIPLMELFHDVTLKTSIGQALDYHTSNAGKPNLELFSMDRHRTIVLYKTAYYSFQFPVALAMYLAGMHDAELHRQAESVLLEMGHLYHVQNDFFNCYAEEDPTGGELYSHIREGKCTWLAVVALQRATPQQRAVMEKCYGSSDENSIKAILNIYEELGLPNMYAMYVEKNYNLINTHIQQMNAKLPKKLFYNFLEMINKRMK